MLTGKERRITHMPEVNYEWVRSQMQEARVKVGVGNALLKLLETWEKINVSPQAAKEVVSLFSQLALTHSVVPEKKDEKWEDARPGFISVGDEVRVKNDAYDGSTGVLHNGRRGKVVGVRFGDIIVKSTDDKLPILDGSHYSPHQIQKRIG